jgi:hypothetical protein
MTSQSSRIYTYKITFEEVPYYYYGMHEEKKYDEEYWGSPKTNKWAWEFYKPKKQILETFGSRKDAYEVETRLIKPVYNTDKWCLNANVGGVLTKKQYKEIGEKTYKLKIGIHSFTKDQRVKNSRKAGKTAYELRKGIHGRSKEQMTKDGQKSTETHRKNKTGAFDLEKKIHSKGGKIAGRKNVESGHLEEISNLKYICTETGFISSARGVSFYQIKRGINKSKKRLLSEEEYREKTRREFTIISSKGEVYKDNNIDKFCKDHNLTKTLFIDLLDGRKISHMGFHLPGTEVKFFVNYEVKSPDGKIIKITNISKFCRENSTSSCKLIVGTVYKMLKGKIKEYKGYTLHKNLISS